MSLDRIGLRTHYASKPDLAVEHLIAERADLIFLDVDLGSTNGFEVHGRLRQIPHHRNTPVLFVSGMSSASERVAQLGSNDNAFLQKPYSLSELRLKALCMLIASRLSAAM
jgi:DNA-binding response OmpR family regulator